jgi:predicted DNA-binding ribbon-helix-helix protein
MNMSFQEWLENKWLVVHKSDKREITSLLRVVDRDIQDCRLCDLSADRKLCTAYNAVLQIAIAALAISGYRLTHESHHYRAIQSLQFTMSLSSDFVVRLDQFRKKRNICDYELAGSVSDHEVKELLKIASELREQFLDWLKKEHPGIIKE